MINLSILINLWPNIIQNHFGFNVHGIAGTHKNVIQIKQALKSYLGIVVFNTTAITNNENMNHNESSQVLHHKLDPMKSQKLISESK